MSTPNILILLAKKRSAACGASLMWIRIGIIRDMKAKISRS
jgi:hypothetical protein